MTAQHAAPQHSAQAPQHSQDTHSATPAYVSPHDYDHSHADVSSGWLRAAVFGAMDGLVSNTGLLVGVAAAGASSGIIILTGVSGLLAGGISMALGEYSSVKSANEQLDKEVRTESEALKRNPTGEERELTEQFVRLGMSPQTAAQAAQEVHLNHDAALSLHLSTELGLTISDRPSPWVAALSSLAAFSTGALIPLLPYLFGGSSLILALCFAFFGLAVTGGTAARFARKSLVRGALRQLLFGAAAMAITYTIGQLLGVSVA